MFVLSQHRILFTYLLSQTTSLTRSSFFCKPRQNLSLSTTCIRILVSQTHFRIYHRDVLLITMDHFLQSLFWPLSGILHFLLSLVPTSSYLIYSFLFIFNNWYLILFIYMYILVWVSVTCVGCPVWLRKGITTLVW